MWPAPPPPFPSPTADTSSFSRSLRRPFVYLWDIYYVNTPTGGLEGWEQPAFHIVSVLMLAVALMGFYKSAMVLRPVARLLLSGVLQTLDDLTCVAQRRWNGFGFGWGAIGCSAKRSGEGLASFEGSSLTATLARGVALVALATAAAVASMRLAEARPRRTRQRQPNLRRRA